MKGLFLESVGNLPSYCSSDFLLLLYKEKLKDESLSEFVLLAILFSLCRYLFLIILILVYSVIYFIDVFDLFTLLTMLFLS